ncbi:uncharacterized protein LOC143280538 [Babylonia areolata]|uniref:uncharacterized protein LOC143280538 n=1 Tax=Babylonia areolata TaxID=304850 RepID=UPI003FD3C082
MTPARFSWKSPPRLPRVSGPDSPQFLAHGEVCRCGSEPDLSFPEDLRAEGEGARGGGGGSDALVPTAGTEQKAAGSPALSGDRQEGRQQHEDPAGFRAGRLSREVGRLGQADDVLLREGHQDWGTAWKRRRFDLHRDGCRDAPLCACAVMERNLLQMAESAYRCVRRHDSSLADFQLFRHQLASTNHALREALDLLSHFRQLCGHRK